MLSQIELAALVLQARSRDRTGNLTITNRMLCLTELYGREEVEAGFEPA